MNPLLHWPTASADIKTNNNNNNNSIDNKKKTEDHQLVQNILDDGREDKTTNYQNFFVGDQKVDVR